MRLLLDTNVLLLFLVGVTQPDRIGGKRLESFTSDDFGKVREWAIEMKVHVSLPNILTETSNLLGDEKQALLPGGLRALSAYIGHLEEIYIPSSRVAVGQDFMRLGLTDAAILSFADKDVCVVSVDHQLCNRLSLKGVDVRNPFHFR